MRARGHQSEVAAEAARSSQRADDHTEPERVDEVDPLEVEHEAGVSVGGQPDEPSAQTWRTGQIEVAVDTDDHPTAGRSQGDRGLHHHEPTGEDPAPGDTRGTTPL